ncbi:MAG: GWxTD domain-containing protein [Schleiferiaceae bacterium]|nr:GWxTD domain-containing protein [Schleiferiaceae bacterium]
MRALSFVIFLLISSFCVHAQRLNASISYATFYSPEVGTYLETHFSIDANTITLLPGGENNSGFQGGVEIKMLVYRNDELVAGDRIRMMSPVFSEAQGNYQRLFNQLRFPLTPNDYLLRLQLTDLNNPAEDYEIDFPVSISFDPQAITLSDVQLLSSYERAQTPTEITKAGYDMIPIVPDGDYYIHADMNKLSFYTEIYNSSTLGSNEPFLAKIYILDALKNRILTKFVTYKRLQSAETVLPVLQSFDIESLQTGTYTLNIELIDKNNEMLTSKHLLFFRDRKEDDYIAMAVDDVNQFIQNADRSFYDKISDIDTLKEYLTSLYAIATPKEQRIADIWVKEGQLDILQQYFLNFWMERNRDNPLGAWQEYKKQVDLVHKRYGTRVLPGHRTDRGRVYLQYGQPTLVEDRRNEPSSYPFEIWQYDQLQSASTVPQTNRVFVFANFNLGTKDYRLIHSDAIGEIQDFRWKLRLVKRDFQTNNVDETGNFMQSDLPGSRLNNNIIMQGASSMGGGYNPR